MPRVRLANNASANLDGAVSNSATSIVLKNITATLQSELDLVWSDDVLVLTIADEVAHEIIIGTEWDSDTFTLTCTRGQDGTSGQEWGDGASIELRLPVYTLEQLFHSRAANSFVFPRSEGTSSPNVFMAGLDTSVLSEDSIAIGQKAEVESSSKSSIAIGHRSGAGASGSTTEEAVAIGYYAAATGHRSLAVGSQSTANADDATAVGRFAGALAKDATCLGHFSGAHGEKSTALGHFAGAYVEKSTAIGQNAEANAIKGLAVGVDSSVSTNGKFGLALGADAEANQVATAVIKGIGCHRTTADAPGTLETDDILTRHRCAPMMTLATGIIDLTDGAASYTIDLPTGYRFYPDRIDVIITAATSPSGAPAIQLGTDADANIASILAASAVTVNAAYERQVFTPVLHGVDNIRVSVETAGTGTLTCRVVVTGYLMENE